jgi:hypothetical protein
MESKLGRGASNLLSNPIIKEGSSTIDWFSPLSGTPISLSSLVFEHKKLIYDNLAIQAKSLNDMGKLLSGDESKQKMVASLIFKDIASSIAKFLIGLPSVLNFFVINESVIMVNWGIKLAQSDENLNQIDANFLSIESILNTGKIPPGVNYPPPVLLPQSVTLVFPQNNEENLVIWNLLRVAISLFFTIFLLSFLVILFFPGLFNLIFSKKPPEMDFNLKRETTLNESLFALKNDYLEKFTLCTQVNPQESPKLRLDLPKDTQTNEESESYEEALLSVPRMAPDVGDSFVIPEGDQDDLSFLEGCWKSDAGLKNSSTGLPLFAIYCLDDKGQGTSTFELYDKKGKRIDTCVGKAVAKRKGESVVIVNDGPRCKKDGAKFTVDTLTCQSDQSQKTACRVENNLSRQNTKKPYYDSKFTYMGANK